MAKARVQKKSYQQSLEDIKEKMKEKRTKRLASASAPRGRARMVNKSNVVNNTNTILKSIQMNNASLAVALQAEKEKVRQANAVILQLKREQQALFLHLLLLKRKLKEQEALSANVSEKKHPNLPAEPQHQQGFSSRKRGSACFDKPAEWNASPVCAENQSSNNLHSEFKEEITLPSTVGVRRRHAERKGQRRSERVKELLSEGHPREALGPLTASPITADDRTSNQQLQEADGDYGDQAGNEEFQHSTPEHVPPRKNSNQQRPARKQTQQLRARPEPAAQKPGRGRKPERAPLKKPWENPKPRTRSKSRDRSAARARGAAQPQGNRLNTSQGFNDTFDFDCEGAVHVTPFKAKADDSQPATPAGEGAARGDEASPRRGEPASSPSLSSESDDSLYVPQKSRQTPASPSRSRPAATRRGRPSKAAGKRVDIPPQPQKISIFRDEPSPKGEAGKEDARRRRSADSSLSHSPDPGRPDQGTHRARRSEADVGDRGLPPVSPLVEAEMMRIDGVLSHFRESPGGAPRASQRVKTCKKSVHGVRTAGRGLSLCDVTNLSPAAFRKFSCSGSRPADGRCSTPVPARKRRCTMAVDYKEPTLNAKLRRGDKFTDLQFLRSPIFKQKPGRRSSVRTSGNSSESQQSLKYNEAFVGCG